MSIVVPLAEILKKGKKNIYTCLQETVKQNKQTNKHFFTTAVTVYWVLKHWKFPRINTMKVRIRNNVCCLYFIDSYQWRATRCFETFFWVVLASLFSPLILIQTKKRTITCGELSFIECLHCTQWGRKEGSHTTATPSGAQRTSETVFLQNSSTKKDPQLSELCLRKNHQPELILGQLERKTFAGLI